MQDLFYFQAAEATVADALLVFGELAAGGVKFHRQAHTPLACYTPLTRCLYQVPPAGAHTLLSMLHPPHLLHSPLSMRPSLLLCPPHPVVLLYY